MTPLVAVRDLVKTYQALRPLRVNAFTLHEAEVVSLVGLDAPAAEMLVGLITGALLPDSGEIRLFDRSTADVGDSEAWLAMLDGVGIMTERAVLIGQFTIEQNIAMPFTLEIDPVADSVKPKVAALAEEAGLERGLWRLPVAQAGSEAQTRVRLARALALAPRLLLAEHPSATLPRDAVARVARDLARIAARRRLALLALTADDAFAKALGGRILQHEPASGALKTASVWRKLFR
jgi:predicted ABC-type transport system involved in lysophospholipase L1 biosynthesis ATPase subunit